MQRTIKSFVLRTGRVSQRQQHALDHWRSDFELHKPEGAMGDLDSWLTSGFEQPADLIVEIGYGMGASLYRMAVQCPSLNFLGIEVHQAGIGSLVADLHDNNIHNVRLVAHDAVDVFKTWLADDRLSGVQIFFPDPWPKKRHHKRRLIQPEFVEILVNKIKTGGFIHCATDWQDYADQMLAVLSAHPQLRNQQLEGGFFPRPDTRPLTKFEQRGQKLGHGVWDLMFNVEK